MSSTAKFTCRLLATTAIVVAAGSMALAQQQQQDPQAQPQQGETIEQTVPIQPAEEQAAEEQPATEEPADAQVTEEQPAAEQPAEEELAEEPAEEPAEATVAEEPAEEPAEEQVAGAPQRPEGPFIDAQEEDQLLASQLMDVTVVGPEGESFGGIQDILLHPEGGIFGAIVSVGGFLGIGAKDVALSWDQFQYSPEEGQALINFTREQLEEAPDFMTLEDQRAEEEAVAQQQMQPADPAAVGQPPAPAAGDTQ